MKYKYRLGNPTVTTSCGLTHTIVASVTCISVPWWKRLWRRVTR